MAKININQSEVVIDKIAPQKTAELAPEIVYVYKTCWLTTYVNMEYRITRKDLEDKFADIEMIINDWKKNILSTKYRSTWLAKCKGVIIGFCIAKKDEKYNELEYIYILPEYQGMGAGHKLLQKAITWLGNDKDCVLFGAAYNSKAINFYKKHGFILCKDKIPDKLLPNGKHIPSMKMIKSCNKYNTD